MIYFAYNQKKAVQQLIDEGIKLSLEALHESASHGHGTGGFVTVIPT